MHQDTWFCETIPYHRDRGLEVPAMSMRYVRHQHEQRDPFRPASARLLRLNGSC